MDVDEHIAHGRHCVFALRAQTLRYHHFTSKSTHHISSFDRVEFELVLGRLTDKTECTLVGRITQDVRHLLRAECLLCLLQAEIKWRLMSANNVHLARS